MGKIFQYLIIAGFLILVGYAYSVLSLSTPKLIPISYHLPKVNQTESDQASQSQILIIGDQSAEIFKPALARIFKNVSMMFDDQVKIYDWTRPNEGVHRTYHKIKSLKKSPPIILYFGGSSEFYEQIFDQRDLRALKSNFKIYNNPKWKSIIMLSEIIGQFIYIPTYDIELEKKPKPQRSMLGMLARTNGALAQKVYETQYLLFSNIFREMINTIKFNGSSFITFTVPTKVTRPPKYVCDNSTSESIIDYQVTLSKALENKQTKKYFNIAKNLTKGSVGNAKSFYLFAKFNESIGRVKNALFNYRLAHAFDCLQDHSNYIINSIIKNVSKERKVTFFDFDDLVHQDFGTDFIFLDHYRPQSKYISELENQVEEKLTDLLNY